MPLAAWVVLVVVLGLALIRHRKKKRMNLPPGPAGLPLIGQAFNITWSHPELTYMKWHRQYGAIFKVTAGFETIVVLCDPELIREAFSKLEATGRPTNSMFNLLYFDNGIVFSSGELWHQTRRFSLFHLRNFGLGKTTMEGAIQDQISDFMNCVLAENEGKPVSIDRTLDIAVLNIIWGLVAGENLGIKDKKMLKLMENMRELDRIGDRFMLMAIMPALMKLPNCLTGLDDLLQNFQYPLDTLLRPAIEAHRRSVDLTSEPRDYIDCLLQAQHQHPEVFTERHILRSTFDLFSAGFDTTSTTLRWAFCFLCACPEAQERLHEELMHVVGDNRPPCLADRVNLPYAEAVIMETQRLANLTPTGLIHLSTADFKLAGYTIPRGAQIVPLFTAVHQSERYFPEPERFLPERFLDAQGKVRTSRALMPFSIGRRSCLGEALARAELFLFITGVVQKYRLRFPDGFSHDFSINLNKMFTNEPKLYLLIAKKR